MQISVLRLPFARPSRISASAGVVVGVVAATVFGMGQSVLVEPSMELPAEVRVMAVLMRRRVSAGPMWFRVRGMSMGPSIPDGWEVQLVAASRPRRGEVWAFCSAQGAIIVHRYCRFEGGAHVFRGDAKQAVDAPVSDDQLIGRVAALRGADAIRKITAHDRFVWRAKQAQRALRARGRAWQRRWSRASR